MTTAIIATTPAAMAESQTKITGWCDARIAAAKHELALADQTFNALQKAGARTHPASAQIRKARTRIAFYEKVRAAVELGYYIVPPFDVQLFAIRTDRAAPTSARGERNWAEDESVRALPLGQGEYQNPVNEREKVGSKKKLDHNSKEYEVAIYDNVKAWGELEFPVRALKPELIDATTRAMSHKIFDALGIAPKFRNADPIILGQIKRPDGKGVLSFFVAWWIDQGDL